jgi:hypothetical protein
MKNPVGRPHADDWHWLDDRLTAELMDLALSPLGCHDIDLLRSRSELWSAPLPASALRRAGRDHTQAFLSALAYVRHNADPAHLAPVEIDAFAAAVGLDDDIALAAVRRDRAASVLGRTYSSYTRPGRVREDGKRSSPESRLVDKVAAALRGDPGTLRTSATSTAERTPSAAATPDGRLDRVVGVWRGTTGTKELAKAVGREGGPHKTYMAVRRVPGGQPGAVDVRWFYDQERDVPAVAVTAVPVRDGLRLVCVYEVDVQFAMKDTHPHHRGCCLLDWDPAWPELITGPYFTDVQTYGILDFSDRVAGDAETFADAERLFAGIPEQNRRAAAVQRAAERVDAAPRPRRR